MTTSLFPQHSLPHFLSSVCCFGSFLSSPRLTGFVLPVIDCLEFLGNCWERGEMVRTPGVSERGHGRDAVHWRYEFLTVQHPKCPAMTQQKNHFISITKSATASTSFLYLFHWVSNSGTWTKELLSLCGSQFYQLPGFRRQGVQTTEVHCTSIVTDVVDDCYRPPGDGKNHPHSLLWSMSYSQISRGCP